MRPIKAIFHAYSKELKDGVIFSAMVIRPGNYLVTNTVNDAKADLVVNYPELGKMNKILYTN